MTYLWYLSNGWAHVMSEALWAVDHLTDLGIADRRKPMQDLVHCNLWQSIHVSTIIVRICACVLLYVCVHVCAYSMHRYMTTCVLVVLIHMFLQYHVQSMDYGCP